MSQTPYVEEFLFRGRCAEHEPEQGASWHVVLAQWVQEFGRPVCRHSAPLTPDAAAALGFDLPAALADINRQTLTELADVRAQMQAASAELEALTQAHAALIQERDALAQLLAAPSQGGGAASP